jgi:hypothetical protein
MFEELWSEIADAPGEIFDISDADREEMAKVFAMSEEEYDQYWNEEEEEPGWDLYGFSD